MAATDPSDFPTSQAVGVNVLSLLDASARCAICFSLFDAPLALRTCGHSFCSACIRQNLSFQERTGQPECPTCRTPCDARDLQQNVALRELLQHYSAARQVVLRLARDADSRAQATSSRPTAGHAAARTARVVGEKSRGKRHKRPSMRPESDKAAQDTSETDDDRDKVGGQQLESSQRRVQRSVRRSNAGKEAQAARALASAADADGWLEEEEEGNGEGRQDRPPNDPSRGKRKRHRSESNGTYTNGGSGDADERKSLDRSNDAREASGGGQGSDAGFCIELSDADEDVHILSDASDDDNDDDDDDVVREEDLLLEEGVDVGGEDNDEPHRQRRCRNRNSPQALNKPARRARSRSRSAVAGGASAGDRPEHPYDERQHHSNGGSVLAPPQGFVNCPICNKAVPSFYINSHVDQCLLSGNGGASHSREPVPEGATNNTTDGSDKNNIKNNDDRIGMDPASSRPFEPLPVPPKLVPTLASEKSLRVSLKKHGLATDGKKPELLERYNNFRLAVETANDRQQRTSFARLAAGVMSRERKLAAAQFLGVSGGGGGAHAPQTSSYLEHRSDSVGARRVERGSKQERLGRAPHVNSDSALGREAKERNTIGGGTCHGEETLAVGFGCSFKELIAATKARDAARKAAAERVRSEEEERVGNNRQGASTPRATTRSAAPEGCDASGRAMDVPRTASLSGQGNLSTVGDDNGAPKTRAHPASPTRKAACGGGQRVPLQEHTQQNAGLSVSLAARGDDGGVAVVGAAHEGRWGAVMHASKEAMIAAEVEALQAMAFDSNEDSDEDNW